MSKFTVPRSNQLKNASRMKRNKYYGLNKSGVFRIKSVEKQVL